MLTLMSVIDYANPQPRRARPIVHTWLLPLLALPATLGSIYWFGDAYGALVLSNFPGIGLLRCLPAPLLQAIESSPACYWIIFGVNMLILAGVGFLLDQLRARVWMYGACIALFISLLAGAGLSAKVTGPQFFQAARDYKPDAICVTWAWSVYLVAAAGIVVTSAIRLFIYSTAGCSSAIPTRAHQRTSSETP